MTDFAYIFLFANALALLLLPRKWAVVPLLIGACYMTGGQGIEIAVFRFTVLRFLLGAGMIRVLTRGERPSGGVNGLDKLMLVWAGWALVSACFHKHPDEFIVNTLGLVYNTLGTYFLFRCFCGNVDDVSNAVAAFGVILAPVAIEMAFEQLSGRNLFAVLGGVPEEVAVRSGRLRAQGPFAHPILAGTVGAGGIPLMVGLLKRRPRLAKLGIVACALVVLASASSGPLSSAIFGLGAMALWKWRHYVRSLRIAMVVGYVLLDIVMKAPAYYLIARIDLVGGSTGWHRSRLIESSFQHLDEWWAFGTDYTRHWMPTGVPWSEDHTDITNHYIAMGVRGGLPLMLLFILLLWRCYSYVGRGVRTGNPISWADKQFVWSMGAALIVHTASCISVAYFDQSAILLWLNMAIIASPMVIGRQVAVRKAGTVAKPQRSAGTPDPIVPQGATQPR